MYMISGLREYKERSNPLESWGKRTKLHHGVILWRAFHDKSGTFTSYDKNGRL